MANELNLNKYNTDDESIDFKELIHKVQKTWYWFVLFGLLGLTGAYVINKTIQPKYRIQSTLFATEDENNSSMTNIFETAGLGTQTNILNHIGILTSYSLTRKTLENLDWKVTWYEDVILSKIDLYKYAPFKIENFNPLLNLPGVKVNVTPVDNDHCLISVDETLRINGVEKTIEFENNYKYGDSLQNEHFNFVLNKAVGRPIDTNKKYFFIFNDIKKITNSYLDRLSVSLTNEEADLILIEVEGTNPEREIDYINELSIVFINFRLREKNQISENTVNFIDAQLSGIGDSLQSAGRSFTNFRSRNRIVDLGQEAGLAVESLEEIETEESFAQMRLEYYQNLLTYLGDANKMEQVIAPSVVGITDPALNSMVISLGQLYNRKSTLSFSVQEKNPTLLALENDITYMRSSLEENLKNLIINTQLQLTSLLERKQQINNELAQLPKTEQDLINMKRQFDLNNELYTYMMQKRAEAAITQASNVPDVQILDLARMDTVVLLGPNKIINFIIGLLLGFSIQFFVIVLQSYFDKTIKVREDIEKETTIPILNVIGHSKNKDNLPVINNPYSGISESFRILRTNLDYLTGKDNRKVIAIHSTIPGEGKTFFTINLASVIAQNNKNVLLIAGDLRKPKVQTIFKISNEKGLSTYLINRDKIDNVMINSFVKNLTIIPSGPIPPNPAELLGNGNLENLISNAKEYFDYIIIDNAPATLVADAVIVGKHVDINIFVTRSEYTTKDQVKLINQFSERETMKNIYIVLNDIEDKRFGYHKYNGKGYGFYKEIRPKKNQNQRIVKT